MIVGSFLNEQYAHNYAEQIGEMGFAPEIIQANNGFYRVSAKRYTSLRDGLNELQEFRSTITTNAWVHIRN
jgi:hypothetical protein